eukprot:360650_1
MYENNSISYELRILILVFFIISTCICFTIAVQFCYYAYFKYTNGIKIRSVQWMTLLGLTMFALSGMALCQVSYYDESHAIFKITDVSNIMFWSTAQTCTYYLFLRRLYHVFSNTAYQLPNSYFFALLFGIMLFLCIEYIVAIGWFLHFVGFIQHESVRFMDLSLTFCAAITDLICSIAFIYLFTSRLSKLYTIDIIRTENRDTTTSIDRQEQLIDVIVRYFLLSCIATVTTQIFLLIFTISDIAYLINSNGNGYIIFENIGFVFWAFDNAVNAICIFMNINFAHNVYHKWCNACHILCLSCFKSNIQKKVYMKQMKDPSKIGNDVTLSLLSSH